MPIIEALENLIPFLLSPVCVSVADIFEQILEIYHRSNMHTREWLILLFMSE